MLLLVVSCSGASLGTTVLSDILITDNTATASTAIKQLQQQQQQSWQPQQQEQQTQQPQQQSWQPQQQQQTQQPQESWQPQQQQQTQQPQESQESQQPQHSQITTPMGNSGEPCREPTGMAAKFLKLPNNPKVMQFYVNAVHMDSDTSLPNRRRHKRSLNGGINKTCPSQPSTVGSIEERSLCPWYYSVNEQADRYPAVLMEAKCKCDQCLGNGGETSCQKVYTEMTVFTKIDCVDGYYQYIHSTEYIATACICANIKL